MLCFQLTPAMECGQTTHQICGATTCLPAPTTPVGLGKVVTPTVALLMLVPPALVVPAPKTGLMSPTVPDQACKICVDTLHYNKIPSRVL